jgi:hypothetical protein
MKTRRTLSSWAIAISVISLVWLVYLQASGLNSHDIEPRAWIIYFMPLLMSILYKFSTRQELDVLAGGLLIVIGGVGLYRLITAYDLEGRNSLAVGFVVFEVLAYFVIGVIIVLRATYFKSDPLNIADRIK